MALMPRSKHKATKGKGTRPHPKSSKRTHSSGAMQARGGGVRAKALRKAERSGRPAAMQTDEGPPSTGPSHMFSKSAGFAVGGKANSKKGLPPPLHSSSHVPQGPSA